MRLDKNIRDAFDQARNDPVYWSFEVNTCGPNGRTYVLLSAGNEEAIDAALAASPYGSVTP